MPERGLTATGFSTPPNLEIYNSLATIWKEKFGQDVDLSDASPDRQFLEAFSLLLSDKGIESRDIPAVWGELEKVFYAGYPTTARGIAVDYIMPFRGLTRQPALKAHGICTFIGSAGTDIPVGTEVVATTGAHYKTTRSARINSYGTVDVPCQAVATGANGNVIVGKITQVLGGLSVSVQNADDSQVYSTVLGPLIWQSIPNDGVLTNYQTVSVSSLRHPLGLDELEISVHNSAESSKRFIVQLVLLNDADGRFIKFTEEQDITLVADESKQLVISAEDTDVSAFTTIRVAVVVKARSEAALDVGLVARQSGSWHLAGNLQIGKALGLKVTSSVVGEFTGGQAAENDTASIQRYFLGLFMGGSATRRAIISELQKVPGLRSAVVDENTTDIDQTSHGGLPRHSIRVTAWGGAASKIANSLLDVVPVGVGMVGETTYTLPDAKGQWQTVHFDRPIERKVYVDISDLVKTPFFPDDGAKQIRDGIIKAVNGADSKGQFWSLRDMGSTVSYLAIAAAVKIPGVESADVLIGFSQPATIEDNLAIGPTDVSVTSADAIRFM